MSFDSDTAAKLAQVLADVAVPVLVGVIGHLVKRRIATGMRFAIHDVERRRVRRAGGSATMRAPRE